jgi:hypothetical protein
VAGGGRHPDAMGMGQDVRNQADWREDRRVMGYGPHEDSARDARQRMVGFFDTHLRLV